MPYGQKRCSRCHVYKPMHEFMAKRGEYEYAYCRVCTSDYQRNRRESTRAVVTPTTCAICGRNFNQDNRPCRDHNHETGQDRDWLCYSCNTGLGKFYDNPLLLAQAIEYLRVNSENTMTVFVDKKILTSYSVDDEEKCQCGGFRNVVHCPACGSTQCYANKRASPTAILPGLQQPTQVRAFRCKLCSLLFSEVDTVIACKAHTRWRQRVEQEQRVNKVVEKASPRTLNAIEEAVRVAAQKRGLLPTPVVDEETAKLFAPPVLEEEEPHDI